VTYKQQYYWLNRERLLAKQQRYQQLNKEKIRAYRRAWSTANPGAVNAQQRLARAVKAGKLKRGQCEICGNPNTHGHHDDYSKPLEVRWLCALHHKRFHFT